MLRKLRLFALPLAALAPSLASAQAPARIVFTFAHPLLQPASYSITIDESGSGHFASQPGSAATDPSDSVLPAPVDRSIRLDATLRATLFAYARSHAFFNDRCDRGKSGLAFTGNRTLTYSGPDGHGTCAFVWTANPTLQSLVDQLGAVAFTLEIGRRLDVEEQHDRLALDSELASLQDAVKDRRAGDLPNIAHQLQAIANDPNVMDRARKRAQSLLANPALQISLASLALDLDRAARCSPSPRFPPPPHATINRN
ncbi:MAG TPA: hypothetical protein VHX60_11150 [Acidobacteriaceae bacterium]|jgi:hypothetical protein|nr:hypothetical protein [Acidobacteriaceae bacterium]